MENFIEAIVAIGITIVSGLSVRCLIDGAVPMPNRPDPLDAKDWQAIIERTDTGKWIGFFERLLLLMCFLMSEYTIVAGWLAFKVAAKWEAWTNIIQVPNTIENIPQIIWYRAKKQFGSWVLSRFLLGTLVNILIAAMAAHLGRHTFEILAWLCTVRNAA
jgi:hypothetical protein